METRFLYPASGSHLFWAWSGYGPLATFDEECRALESGLFEENREDILTPDEILTHATHLATWQGPGVFGLDVTVCASIELLVYLYGMEQRSLAQRITGDPSLC